MEKHRGAELLFAIFGGQLVWQRKMKRGIGEEETMGPMFPRLHVNDTEKGGPRAPPRNKMALYEHLSIPSQRYSPGDFPLDSSNSASLVPSHSSQVNQVQIIVFYFIVDIF